MKRTERHRLKENEVAQSVARARDWLDAHRRTVIASASGVAIVLIGVLGWVSWRQHVDSASRALLAEAVAVADAQVVPPAAPGQPGTPATPAVAPPGSFPTDRARLEAALAKFLAAADRYPSTQAGIAARYQAAAVLAALGRTDEAVKHYQEVIDRAGTSVYAEAARLGQAEAQVRAGRYDAAIANYTVLASGKNVKMPLDGVLMHLARAYVLAGKAADARKTFQRIVDEFPDSVYASLARRELEAVSSAG